MTACYVLGRREYTYRSDPRYLEAYRQPWIAFALFICLFFYVSPELASRPSTKEEEVRLLKWMCHHPWTRPTTDDNNDNKKHGPSCTLTTESITYFHSKTKLTCLLLR